MSSSSPNDAKLDPRVRRTRALLGQAFVEALSEKGFQAISVQDITERAGVNRTTFYLHFPDKYALVDYSVSQMFRQEIEKREMDVCHFSEENLRSLIIMVSEFVAFSSSHCARPEPQFESLVETQVKKQVQDVLQMWLEQTGSRVDSRTAAIAASWAVYGLALQWTREKKRPSVAEFAENVSPLITAILGLAQPA